MDGLMGCAEKRIGKRDMSFASRLVAWQKRHGRHALPWQHTRDAYRIWLSEIMLQQTQVTTVIPYYERFLAMFPDVFSLANAPLDAVMQCWSGLGYYSRARNLHKCARRVVDEYQGIFPSDPVLLERLPGIGRSTAAAIAVFSSGAKAAILDGNVVRVFARVFGLGDSVTDAAGKRRFWQLAVDLLPDSDIESYTQGLMDLGATVCTRGRPDCTHCPFSGTCIALSEGRVDELPVKKAKKPVPVRHVVMLLVYADGRILLQKRPASGIWGGLYSLPEITMEQDGGIVPDEEVASRVKLEVARWGNMESMAFMVPFEHVFTHFRLQITPCIVKLARKETAGRTGEEIWPDAASVQMAALPAAVRKLLDVANRQGYLAFQD